MKSGSTIALIALVAAVAFIAGRSSAPVAAEAPPAPAGTDRQTSRTNLRAVGERDYEGLMADAHKGQPHGALKSAMRGALGNTLESKRLDRWMKLLAVMRSEDAPAIASILLEEELAGREFKPESMAFWQTWAQIDAPAAWNFLQKNAHSRGASGTEALVKAWAFTDPAAAMEAFGQLAESPLKEAAFAGLAHGLAETNPSAAMKFAMGLSDDQQQEAAVHITGSIIYQQGNEAAQTWFDGLPNEAAMLQKETARVMLESLSRSGAGAVEKFAVARLDQPWMARPDEQLFTSMMILRNGGDPESYVSEVIQKYPNAEDPLGLATQVSARKPDAMLTWIEANSDHPALDTMIGGAVKAAIQRDGGRTAESDALLAKIRNPTIRGMFE